MLDADRLLWVFRKNVGLPTPGKPYIGSWEDPKCELRGHFVGHYLSALALAYAGTGNVAFKARLSHMVSELAKVQALLPGGYLSAFPTSWFDRVESLRSVWAPYYTIHKIMAGLVDAYELGDQAEGLNMASKMAAYHYTRTKALIKKKGWTHWQDVLEFEFGGMNEILYRMYGLTKDPDHLAFARMFDKRIFLEEMEAAEDNLYDLHANTHLAQVVGFAAGYESTRNQSLRVAVNNFFEIITQHHGFATGGTSVFERWEHSEHYAYVIAERDGSNWVPRNALKTHETCTQYNMLKIARSLFLWTGDTYYADHYERAMVNGMLGVARLPPEDWVEGHAGHASHHHHHRHLSALRDGMLAGPGARAPGGQLLRDTHAAHAELHAAEHAGHGAHGHGAKAGPGKAGSLVSPYTRYHDDEWGNFIGFSRPRPEWNVSDAHGPGVYLYLLPMGHGNSKSDNLHHWGFPFHSFWCCYGTIIESYAKLADSIYFKDMKPEAAVGDAGVKLPPRLYINQLVSSTLTWTEMGVRVKLEADMFAPGPATTAEIKIEPLLPSASPTFTVMLRIPAWAVDGAVRLEINGLQYNGCPGAPLPNTYCKITGEWSGKEAIHVRIALRWWYSPAADKRVAYQSLKAIMLGPYVMAGLTHDDYTVGLPEDMAAGRGLAAAGPEDRMFPPEEADEMLSLQTSWNSSLFIRHDASLLYASSLDDGGDMMDATFRLGRGCELRSPGPSAGAAAATGDAGPGGGGGQSGHEALSALHGSAAAQGGGGADTGHGSFAGAFASLRSLMRLGQHDAAQHLTLEAMGYPHHYVAYDHTDVIVLQPGPTEAGASASASCSNAMWMMRPGLDGASDTVSFEAVARPGHFLSALASPQEAKHGPPACRDAAAVRCDLAEPNGCATSSFVARVLCRKTCGSCLGALDALRLRQHVPGSLAFASASSFRLAPAARRAYPAGSYVLAGSNRHFLLAPLGNLVDERYTTYFNVLPDYEVPVVPRRTASVAAASSSSSAAAAAFAFEAPRVQGAGVRSSMEFLLDPGAGDGGFWQIKDGEGAEEQRGEV
ncbi:hypothetical protein HYH03_002755 [Edaphochlamys debaryana]|uniref:Uncharacterized protein n=1 Tax=Edaphochlamys debaryana TaxID=47281 RepID=A0A835YK63_9CHLO|nr:hypothetical protein HYH03_002755 [Edaphochlamys debaryana]|eukprot:KAG2499174.1 hypothetical protein HYH03_002755 [Edaphochlamys debaryana]